MPGPCICMPLAEGICIRLKHLKVWGPLHSCKEQRSQEAKQRRMGLKSPFCITPAVGVTSLHHIHGDIMLA